MTADTPENPREFSRLIPKAALSGTQPIPIDETANATERAALGELVGAGIAKLRVKGRLTPDGAAAWRLKARLTAKLTQTCVVTLDPIDVSIDETIDRLYADVDTDGKEDLDFDPEADDPPDPIGPGVDIGAAATEALALAVDPYPRSPGADFAPQSAAPPGVEPMGTEQPKPFAGLAALKKAMEQDK